MTRPIIPANPRPDEDCLATLHQAEVGGPQDGTASEMQDTPPPRGSHYLREPTDEITWSEDNESVTCPSCGESWADLWDYDWGNREELRIECPCCDAPLTLHRRVSVDYGISHRREAK